MGDEPPFHSWTGTTSPSVSARPPAPRCHAEVVPCIRLTSLDFVLAWKGKHPVAKTGSHVQD